MSKSKPNTLALVISSLRMGGAERVASLVANELASQYRILLFVWSDKDKFYPLDSGVKVQVLATKQSGILGNLIRIFKLYRAFKTQEVDLSIGFIHQTNVLTILASKMAKIPCIATEHSVFNALSSKFWRILRYFTYPLASCVTTLTQQDFKHYSFVKNVSILPNPVEIPQNSHASVKIEDIESYKPYILTAGRMITSKGFDELIEAFRIFSTHSPQYSLLLAGDGIQRKALEEQAKGLKCKFLGKIESLTSYYANADFFALASHREALSNVLIESLLCGTPVVSYDCPYGPREIITCDSSHNGILVKMNEKRVESLAAAFVKMSQNRESYAKNTFKIQERFSHKVVLEKWRNLICQSLQQ